MTPCRLACFHPSNLATSAQSLPPSIPTLSGATTCHLFSLPIRDMHLVSQASDVQASSPSQPRQFALTIAVRSWWLCGLRKAEPIEEHQESRIILDLTRCGRRLNNRAAILQSKIT